jgi:murein DD-endopeptidase MepM/ murein hydrolase activator NlpD
MRKRLGSIAGWLVGLVMLAACQALTMTPTASPSPATTPTFTITPWPIQPSATPTPELILCSPLQGITMAELPEIISQPFAQPQPGLDDGHQGVDLAFYRYRDLTTMERMPVQAVLPGTVAAVVDDRLPYGNMLIIETPLEDLPSDILQYYIFPTPAPTVTSDGRLTCPTVTSGLTFAASGRSLYILYAHLNDPPDLAVGDPVAPCQVIGRVGDTGESSQYHLHLEMRIGPAGARFTSIAHRSGAATEEEMANYCIWRISDLFHVFDPMSLLSLQP